MANKKPQPRTILSDDFKIMDNGEEIAPHEGEHIVLPPSLPIGEYQTLARFYAGLRSGDPNDGNVLARMDTLFEEACQILARRLRSWTWTDDEGEALPQPKGNPDAIRALSDDEMYYLLGRAINGRSAAEAKNADAPAPTT
ncbi:MAG: hypothetical protein NTZ05_14995 [Chloroflexi bacterium]|nr:hypothetical protein [Chloroflexota bacterium]